MCCGFFVGHFQIIHVRRLIMSDNNNNDNDDNNNNNNNLTRKECQFI